MTELIEPRIRLSPGLVPHVYLRPPAQQLPFPLSAPGCRLFARGRHALWHGVQAAGLASGDEVLVPAYNCGAEVEALVQAGLTCRFYEACHDLEPDESELESLVGPRTRALLIIHYLGFPRHVGRWRAWCDHRGLLLVEDAAAAWLAGTDADPVGAVADVAIFSLYKTLPLPDGAALVVAEAGGSDTAPGSGSGAAAVAKRHAQWLMSRIGPLDVVLGRYQRATGTDFELGVPAGASQLTRFLLPRTADAAVAARRRDNYRQLLQELHPDTPAPFATLPSGAAPLAFPLAIPSEWPGHEGVQQRLEGAGVEAMPLWPRVHPLVPVAQFPRAQDWRRRFLMLPVHQELRPRDLERVVAAVRGPARRDGRVGRASRLRLEPLQDLEGCRAEWSELAAATGNLFATWEWHSTWWRHFGLGRSLMAAAARTDGGRLAAVLPLYVTKRGPARLMRFIGHGQGDRLGPICAGADAEVVAATIRHAMAEGELGGGLLLGEQLPAEERWGELLGARILRREPSPVLRIEHPDWDSFLSGCSSSLRKQVRYQERRLAREHDLRYRLVEDPHGLPEAFDAVFALHRARWGDEGAVAYLGSEGFHRDFGAVALQRGWLRLWLMEVDGQVVAAWHGFRFGGADWHYQSGRNPAWDELSVGAVLLAHTLRDSIVSGVREYRFLRGGEAYKFRFANADPGSETIALGRGGTGRAAAVAAGAAARLPASAKIRIRRLTGG